MWKSLKNSFSLPRLADVLVVYDDQHPPLDPLGERPAEALGERLERTERVFAHCAGRSDMLVVLTDLRLFVFDRGLLSGVYCFAANRPFTLWNRADRPQVVKTYPRVLNTIPSVSQQGFAFYAETSAVTATKRDSSVERIYIPIGKHHVGKFHYLGEKMRQLVARASDQSLAVDRTPLASKGEAPVVSPARQPIPPALRWTIFRRDNFACVYCGRTATDGAILEIDHRRAVALGGDNDPGNLFTACRDCNAGKGAKPL